MKQWERNEAPPSGEGAIYSLEYQLLREARLDIKRLHQYLADRRWRRNHPKFK